VVNNDIKNLIPFAIDHVGIAVHNLDESEKFYRDLGFSPGHREVVEREKVSVSMLELSNNSRIELIAPTDPESAVAKFLAKRGPGIHHICLRVENVKSAIEKLKSRGHQMINDEPFVGAHNCLVAFVHPKSTGGVLLELSQKLTAQ
jgi:methylmalonyl-CoA epimerase